MSPEPGPSGMSSTTAETDTPRIKFLRRRLFQEISRSRKKTEKIRVLGQRLKRYKKIVVSLKQMIQLLQKKN